MRAINARETLTPREVQEFNQEKELAVLSADAQLKYKTLELELKKIETRWSQVFRIPFAIIALPIRFTFGLAYIVHAIRKTEPSAAFWTYLSKM